MAGPTRIFGDAIGEQWTAEYAGAGPDEGAASARPPGNSYLVFFTRMSDGHRRHGALNTKAVNSVTVSDLCSALETAEETD